MSSLLSLVFGGSLVLNNAWQVQIYAFQHLTKLHARSLQYTRAAATFLRQVCSLCQRYGLSSMSTASYMPDFSTGRLRDVIFVMSIVLALLGVSSHARKIIHQAPDCVLKPETSAKMPPEPTQCPCGPTTVRKPIGDQTAEVLIVYEAWAGYCGSPWLASPEHEEYEDYRPANLACSAAAACCLSATYFVEGEKPKVREFMSCPGSSTAQLANPSHKQETPIEHKYARTDTLQVLPGVATGGFASVQSFRQPEVEVVDGTPTALSVPKTEQSHARSGGGVMQKISQVLQGVFVNAHDASMSVAIDMNMPVSIDMLVDSNADVDVVIHNVPEAPCDPDYYDYPVSYTHLTLPTILLV